MSPRVAPIPATGSGAMDEKLTPEVLDQLNVAQATRANKEHLDSIGGLRGLAALLQVDLKRGLTDEQAAHLRARCVFAFGWAVDGPVCPLLLPTVCPTH